jgi:hypothetical protein
LVLHAGGRITPAPVQQTFCVGFATQKLLIRFSLWFSFNSDSAETLVGVQTDSIS